MSTISTTPSAPASDVSESVPVKLSVLGEFRRFNVSGFDNLRSSISSIVGHDSFVVKYTDSDGDEVSVTNQAEFAVASSSVPAGDVLRVNVFSTRDDDKKAAKRAKKRARKTAKRQQKSLKKHQKNAIGDSESSESDDSASASEIASESITDSSDSSEEKPKKEKAALKRQKKALKALRKQEKWQQKKAAKPAADTSESSTDESSTEITDPSRTLEELKAQVARLDELHKKQKADRKAAKQAKKALKKSGGAKKKCRKHAAAEASESDFSSSAEEIVSSESSPSSSEEKKLGEKARKQEIKKDGKVALKALKEEVRQAQHRLCEAKKSLQRQIKTAKAEMKLKEDARFVAHVTYPDPASVEANASILKTFKFRNSGTATWVPSTKLLLVSRFDNSLSAPEAVEIGREVKPEEEIDVTVPLKAPAKQGQYDAFFRLALPGGRKFGQRVRSRIFVTPPTAPRSTGSNGLTPAPVDTGVLLVAEATPAIATSEEPMVA